MTTNFSNEFAAKMILTAIEAGGIKLNGPGTTPAGSKIKAQNDSEYLKQLFTMLTTGSGTAAKTE